MPREKLEASRNKETGAGETRGPMFEHPCEEEPVNWLKINTRRAPVTFAMIAACLVLWIATALQSGSFYDNYYGSELAREWTLWGPDVFNGSWYQVVTSAFIHIGLGHLLVNMAMLLFIGPEVERALGSGLFAIAYATGVLGSAAAVLAMNFLVPTAGASGVLFALMILLVGVFKARGLNLTSPLTLLAANVVYSFIQPGVSLWGHLGGVFAGAVMVFAVTRRNPRARWWGTISCCALSVVAVWWALPPGAYSTL